jgi:hypothetical protein
MNPRLIQIPSQSPPSASGPFALHGLATTSAAASIIPRPPELGRRDWAIFLLHTAAEVEHALLVQYLFAAYSIKTQPIPGPPPNASTSSWSRAIVKIAKEEMGHLLSLQNLLRFVGAPINLEREDFPMRTLFYPFAFTLERFTKDSLSKYLFAEMPEDAVPTTILTPEERAEIEDRARRAAGISGGTFLNHVGTLYRTLDAVFRDPQLDGFRPARFPFQARAEIPWILTDGTAVPAGQMPTGVKLFRITSRQDAIDALSAIARQGEAASGNPELMKSHFGGFLKIYREFPNDFVPSWPVANNPNTNRTQPTAGTITNDETFLWAQLFNLRYRILLTLISHSVLIRTTLPGQPDDVNPLNNLLVNWVYEEMSGAGGCQRTWRNCRWPTPSASRPALRSSFPTRST